MSKTGTRIALRNNGFLLLASSMMSSGDSPTSEHKENVYNYGRPITPPPTTSHQHTVAPAPPLPPKPQQDEPDESNTIPSKEDRDQDVKDQDSGDRAKSEQDDQSKNPGGNHNNHQQKSRGNDQIDSTKINGANEKLSPEWITHSSPNSTKSDSENADDADEEDDSCFVNCLYYTMQCCECSIT